MRTVRKRLTLKERVAVAATRITDNVTDMVKAEAEDLALDVSDRVEDAFDQLVAKVQEQLKRTVKVNRHG